MSEYQDYRWSCVNRSLSRADAKQIDQLSSHINVSAAAAQVDYAYGDFKHDPIKVLGSYFDVFTYEANWGSQTVAFRFDAALVDYETIALFSHGDSVTVKRAENSVIVKAAYWEEDFMGSHWIMDEIDDERFHRIYSEMLHGDFRGLFLLWLKSLSQCDPDQRNHSAPIPRGLADCHSEHAGLAEFIWLDPDLIEAAAQLPSTLESAARSHPDLASLLKKLPAPRMRQILSELLSGDAVGIARALKDELTSLAPKNPKKPPTPKLVPFTNIEKLANDLKETRERKAREEEQKSKDAHLKSLALYEPKIWRLVEPLILEKKPKAYDQAVDFLHGLRELYEHRGTTDLFTGKVTDVVKAFPTLVGMRDRMREAGHLSADLPVKRKLGLFIEQNRSSPAAKRQEFIDGLLAEIADRSL